jgi:hypothetical protein
MPRRFQGYSTLKAFLIPAAMPLFDPRLQNVG